VAEVTFLVHISLFAVIVMWVADCSSG